MAQSFSVQYIFFLKDMFTAGARVMAKAALKLKAAIHAAGASLGTLTGALAAFGAAAGVAAVALAAFTVGAAADFEDAMANVRRVTDITRQEMLDYGKSALKVGVDTGQSGRAIADIMTQAALMGIRGEGPLTKFADTVARVAVAWDDISHRQASQSLALMTQKFFGDLPSDQQVARLSNVADAMNELSNRSAFRAPELVKFFDNAASAAKNFGLTAEQAAAFGGSALVLGQPSGYRQGYRAFATFTKLAQAAVRANKKQAAAIGALGYTEQGFRKKLEASPQGFLIDFLERVNKLGSGIEVQATLSDLLTQRSARQVMSLANNVNEYKRQLAIADDEWAQKLARDEGFMGWLKAGSKGMREIYGQLKEFGKVVSRQGSVEREFQKRTETLRFAATQLGESFRRARILLGMPMLEPLREWVNWMTRATDAVGDFIERNQSAAGALMKGGLVAGLGAAGYYALKLAGYLTGAGGALGALAALGKAAIAITIVATIVGAGAYMLENWDQFSAFFDKPHHFNVIFPEAPQWLKDVMSYLAPAWEKEHEKKRKQGRLAYQMNAEAELRRAAGTTIGTANWFRNLVMPTPPKEWMDKQWATIKGFDLTSSRVARAAQSNIGVPLPARRPDSIPKEMTHRVQVESQVRADVNTSFQPANVNVNVSGTVNASGLAQIRGSGSGTLQANRGRASATASSTAADGGSTPAGVGSNQIAP